VPIKSMLSWLLLVLDSSISSSLGLLSGPHIWTPWATIVHIP
jgi:hypothetical protein